MGYILDVILILIFALAVFRGLKKGFVHGIIGLVGTIAAFVIAFMLSAPIAEAAYGWFVKSPTENAIASNIDDTAKGSLDENLAAAETALPGYVKSLMDSHDVTLAEITESSQGGIENTSQAIASAVTERVVRPTIVLLIRCIVCIVLVIALLIAVAVVGKLLKKLIHITPLKKLDGALGAVLGVVRGLLWGLLAVTIMQTVAGFTAPDALISHKSIKESVVVSRVASINPIYSGNILNIWSK